MMMTITCAAWWSPWCRRTDESWGRRAWTWRPSASPCTRSVRIWTRLTLNRALEFVVYNVSARRSFVSNILCGFEGFWLSLFLPSYYFPDNKCSCGCVWRLRRMRTKHPKTSSATIRPRPAARRTSTRGRCRSGSRCPLANTCWCPPPFSPTTRQTSWSGCSPRRRLELCECQLTCIRTRPGCLLHSCEVLSHREMGSTVDADLPEVSPSDPGPEKSPALLMLTECVCSQPPPPSLPEEESDEEKGLRRLFDQLAGDVRPISHPTKWVFNQLEIAFSLERRLLLMRHHLGFFCLFACFWWLPCVCAGRTRRFPSGSSSRCWTAFSADVSQRPPFSSPRKALTVMNRLSL